jgi:formylglycine-generating enzyme required for sulfatase activity
VESVKASDLYDFFQEFKNKFKYEVRLPKELEYRQALMCANNNSFFWGNNNMDDYVWHSGNSSSVTHAVKLKKAAPCGLYDLFGNVRAVVTDPQDSTNLYPAMGYSAFHTAHPTNGMSLDYFSAVGVFNPSWHQGVRLVRE